MLYRSMLAFACLVVGVASASAKAEDAAAAPTATLICDKTPIETGLSLSRDRIAAGSVTIDGKQIPTWVSRHNSVPADEWARSFLIKVTDPRFQKGAMPAVDIEVTYVHEANTKVEVVADTESGSRVIGAGWGNSKALQTIKIHLDDAYFGARPHGNDPKTLPSDGFDLRINAYAGDFQLREVEITGVDRKQVADWSRFLSVGGVASESGDFIVAPGGSDKITFDLRNKAMIATPVKLVLQTFDGGGKVLGREERDVTLGADGSLAVEAPFDAAARPVGEYAVRLSVKLPGQTVPLLAREQPLVVAGPEDLFIIFDKTPIARGIEFDRTAVSPVEVTVNGAKRWAWQANAGSQRGGEGWWKSFVFNITDKRFQNGGRPAVDVIVNYRHVANAPMNVYADTAGGSREVVGGWGNSTDWQRQNIRIDDALFNDTDYGSDPKAVKSDGFDFRVNFNSGDGQLRSIFVRGYPLDAQPGSAPDYRRLLRFDSVDAGRELFIFDPGEKTELKLKLTNLARVPLDAVYSVTLVDDFNNEIWTHRHTVTIAAAGDFDVPAPFDTAGLKQGVYTIRLSLGHEVDGSYAALIERDVNVMVSERSAIEKTAGKPGDGTFLYGLDSGVESFDERWLQWADFMGVDILRGPGQGHNHTDTDALGRAFAVIGKHNLRATQFFDIPWDEDPARRQQKWEELAKQAEAITREFGDKVYYYELGNEPDLTYFYPGPIEEYAKGFAIVAKAIKRGDPQSLVMNGGLCFAGEEGDRRARRLVEVIDPKALDGWAYHAHGPGAGAERNGYERLRAVAAKYGKADRPYMETESGVSARSPMQIRVQARTATQKLVYSQSVGLDAFMWFRLNITGGDGDYTSTLNVHEPRPVVLSYRTTARTLKGLRFVRKIELPDSAAEAYLFAEPAGERRALVYWTDGRGGQLATMGLGGPVTNLAGRDLFGNPLPQTGGEAGIVTTAVENDPAYLTWSGGDVAKIAPLRPILLTDAVATVTPGGRDEIVVKVRNDSDRPMNATLIAAAAPETGVTPVDAEKNVTVPPRATTEVRVALETAPSANVVRWPNRWAVFTGMAGGSVDPRAIKDVPQTIEANGKTLRASIVRLKDGSINLAVVGGTYKERTEAICVAEIDSPDARTIRVGAAADWWMAWFVNGQPVYDTLEQGNGGPQSLLAHQFDMPLRAGKNLIVARVLSGSQGFRLTCGGPQELAAAKTSAGPGDDLSLSLKVGDQTIARQRVALSRRTVLGASPAPFDGPIAALGHDEPAGDLLEGQITNEWAKQPDSSKWYKGPDDLSASVWAYADTRSLQVLVAVRDDTPRAGDDVRLSIATPDHAIRTLAASDAKAAVTRTAGPGGTMWYRFTIRRTTISSNVVSINVEVVDDDFGGVKQTARWFASQTDPVQWWQCALP